MREYHRIYRSRLSSEKIEQIKKQQREHKREIFKAKSPKQKKEFYKHVYIVARKRGQYDNASEESAKAYRALRDGALTLLGNRCSNPNCKWMNEDGTFGCTLRACLQIDHVNGGGRKEKEKAAGFLRKVLKDTTGAYQLLCSNCNWIKRIEKGEYTFRRSLKMEKKVA